MMFVGIDTSMGPNTTTNSLSKITGLRPDAAFTRVFRYAVNAAGAFLTFSHLSYARYYLLSAFMMPFSFLHYVLVGNKRGYIPNPFFDPYFAKSQFGHASYFRYILCSTYWSRAPSSWFEPAPSSDDTSFINPLILFLTFGGKRCPSRAYDADYVKTAVCRDRIQKRWLRFKLAADRPAKFPMNRRDLYGMQVAYRQTLGYRVLRAGAQRNNRFLVFVQVNRSSDLTDIPRPHNFDLMLNYYDFPPSLHESADIITYQKGTKTTGIANVLRHDPDLLLRYDAVMFLDDDIGISGRQIIRLFDIFCEAGLDLAQPSLTAESHCYFQLLKQPRAGHGLRKMNGVEIMMPIVSQRALREFGWVFSEGVSGWGVDLLLSAKVRERFGDTIALIGEVVVAHERQVDTVNGTFYRELRANGIDANSEAGDIIHRYGVSPYAQRIRPVLKGSKATGFYA